MSLQHQLRQLQEAGLITEVSDHDEPSFTFHHALIQDAAYDSLLRADRRRLHMATGRALERSGADPAVLAHHFLAAEEYAIALRYFVSAADEAAARFATNEAIGLYRHALRLALGEARASDLLPHLYRGLGRALELSVRYQEALELYQEQEALAKQRRDQALELASLLSQAIIRSTWTTVYNEQEGRSLGSKALHLARQIGDQRSEVRALWTLLLSANAVADTDEAVMAGTQALGLARNLGLKEELAYVLHDLSAPYRYMGHIAQAQALLDEALPIWRELGNLPMQADSLSIWGMTSMFQGRAAEAMAAINESMAICQRIKNQVGILRNLMMLSSGRLILGDVGGALALLPDFEALAERVGMIDWLPEMYAQAGWIYKHLGDYRRAEALIIKGLKATPLDSTSDQRLLLSMQARIVARSGDIDRAWLLLKSAYVTQPLPEDGSLVPDLVLAERELALITGRFDDVLRIVDTFQQRANARVNTQQRDGMLLYRAQALMGLGRHTEALETLNEALELSSEYPKPLLRWRILMALSQTEARLGHRAEARDHLREAQAIIEQIAASLSDLALRESFLQLPDVQQLLEAVA